MLAQDGTLKYSSVLALQKKQACDMEEVAVWSCQYKMFVYTRITPKAKFDLKSDSLLSYCSLKTIVLINIWVPMMCLMLENAVHVCVCVCAQACVCVQYSGAEYICSGKETGC